MGYGGVASRGCSSRAAAIALTEASALARSSPSRIGSQWFYPRGALVNQGQAGSQGAFSIVAGIEKLLQARALFAVFVPQLVVEPTVGPEFLPKRLSSSLRYLQFTFEIQPEIFQEGVHSAHRQAPAGVGAFIPGEKLDDTQRCFAVGVEDLLRDGHAFRTAVSLQLLLVGIELKAPHLTCAHQRADR